MRLLQTTTLEVTEHFPPEVPAYGILSHRWGSDEVDYHSMSTRTADTASSGYQKMEGACWLARAYGLEWIWIDTVCIDKSSSAELSEAINSMFNFYLNAELCIAYLADVPTLDDPEVQSGLTSQEIDDRCFIRTELFRRSVWFIRGWTLQELLAPRRLEFYDRGFRPIGSRTDLCEIVSRTTGIATSYLNGRRPVNRASVAVRMSWASGRRTTRIEDEAYSLLGIFGVSMPLLYGEGKMSFFRLQREILANSDDESVFAWIPARCEDDDEPFGMLAESPRDFYNSGNIHRIKVPPERRLPYSLTNKGLEFKVGYSSFLRASHQLGPNEELVPLACQKMKGSGRREDRERKIAIVLRRMEGAWYRVKCCDFLYATREFSGGHFKTFYIPQPSLTTTPRLSGVDYSIEARRVLEQKRRRDVYMGATVIGLGTLFTLLGASAYSKRKSRDDSESRYGSAPYSAAVAEVFRRPPAFRIGI